MATNRLFCVGISGVGGILFDGEARIFLREVDLAHERGIPVMIYGVSAGPLVGPQTQAQVTKCIELAESSNIQKEAVQGYCRNDAVRGRD